MQVTTIGLDLAKHVFQIHGIDAAEKVVRLANECPTPSVSEKLMALAAEYLERAAGLSDAPVQQQQQIQPKEE
jgi:hypothetical protein